MSSHVDFTKPHDPDDYFHYSHYVNGVPTYESYQRSTNSIVYQGPISYHERKDPVAFKLQKLKKSSNYDMHLKKTREMEYQQQMAESGVLRKK